eukprot:CAMPEP_0202861356 /NCGR_PEP_ID=MMETSP1391-20130828/2783_1 /ASSEMBLY_ACC=CAM_ASM_000867 /TAXON_ID=1034604 /ORGANISM="Chlamydomonas leiostraca, Strain SAG 11-49" /LENGTH=764 /DNA_ID=CAMNT_0049540735 /DNA_START=73 /DNA_END=2368 /DNA_ORIENTATION=-
MSCPTKFRVSIFRCILALVISTTAVAGARTTSGIHAVHPYTRRPDKCSPCVATLHLEDVQASTNSVNAESDAASNSSGTQRPLYLAPHQRYRMVIHSTGDPAAADTSDAAAEPGQDMGTRKQGSASAAAALEGDAGASDDGPELQDGYLIHIVYNDSYESEGWDRLEVKVNDRVPIPASIKAHAAGYAEAYFTSERMHKYWTNYRMNEYAVSGGTPAPALLHYVHRQSAFVRAGVGSKGRTSKYWKMMGLVMAQFDGLCEGYWANVGLASHNMTWEEMYLLQSVGDLYELNVLYPPHPKHITSAFSSALAPASETLAAAPNLTEQEIDELLRSPPSSRHYSPGHGEVGQGGITEDTLECSAAIKLTPKALERLRQGPRQPLDTTARTTKARSGSDTTAAAAAAVRGGGRRLRAGAVAGTRAAQAAAGGGAAESGGAGSAGGQNKGGATKKDEEDEMFWAGHATWRPYYAMIRTWKAYDFPWSETGPLVVSSSPGLLYSKDDWYTTDRFVVMETTNGVYNKRLYDHIPQECALVWQRALVANLGATGGQEWVSLFAKHNSGTYNNQWMVLDVDALSDGWQHDVLWVLEQLPGYTQQADVTGVLLANGTWPSYNVPYFKDIYNMSGYPLDQDVYRTAPRARIFERDLPGVSSTEHLRNLLRYNRYQSDEMSEGRPSNAIASRYDLTPLPGHRANWTRKAFGSVDAKVVDGLTFRERTTHVISGPTTDDQEPFGGAPLASPTFLAPALWTFSALAGSSTPYWTLGSQ